MDRSFGGSTSVMQTPSPANRRLNAQSSSSQLGPATRSVKFSPAQSTQQSHFNPTASGSLYAGPASRLQSYSALATPQRSNSSTAIRQVPSQPTPPATQPSQVQQRPLSTPNQYATPVRARVADAAHSAAHATSVVADKVQSQVQRMPLGRGEAAKRLRVNSVLLVSWWIASRTSAYGYGAGRVAQAAPSLDVPLHLLESCVYLLLCFNIAESIYRLQALSGLPVEATTVTSINNRAPSRPIGSASLFATPTRSSPKVSGYTALLHTSPCLQACLPSTDPPIPLHLALPSRLTHRRLLDRPRQPLPRLLRRQGDAPDTLVSHAHNLGRPQEVHVWHARRGCGRGWLAAEQE